MHIVDAYAVVVFPTLEMCAGKPVSVPGGRGGYLHGWAAGLGEQG